MIIIQGVDYMFLRKLGKRGVAMTEYAVLLAFVAAIGGSFASDNGLSGSINAAIGKAKDAINLVIGGESNSVNSKYTFLEGTEPYKSSVSSVVDKLYDKFNKEGKLLASISWDDDGNINRVSYYIDSDPNNKQYSNLEETSNVSSEYGASQLGDVLGSSSMTPVNNGHIAFDKEGNVIKWLDNQHDRLDYTHMDFVSVNDGSKYYQIEAGKSVAQNTFSHVTVGDLNKNDKYKSKTSNYE